MSTGIGLSTDGYYGAGGGSSDTTPPTIEIISPTPGVAPGEPGGFPRRMADAKVTPIVCEITDLTSPISVLVLSVAIGTGDLEVAYRDGIFVGDFVKNSFREDIADGYRFTLLPDDGWPSLDTDNYYVRLAVDAADGNAGVAVEPETPSEEEDEEMPLIAEHRANVSIPVSEDLPITLTPLTAYPDAEVFVADVMIAFNCDADGGGLLRLEISLLNNGISVGNTDRLWIDTDAGATVYPVYAGRWVVPIASLGTLSVNVSMANGGFCEAQHCSLVVTPTLTSRVTLTP